MANAINRLLSNICTGDIQASKAFYTTLFDFDTNYDSDWFVHLISNSSNLELGIIDKNNEIVPDMAKSNTSPSGFYQTFVVEDVDKVHERALENGFDVLESPHDTFYGQRRLLLKDPDGSIVDVSAPIENFQP